MGTSGQDARVIVLSLPPLGEATSGEAVAVIDEYNEAIRSLAKEDPRAIYVPFGERLRELEAPKNAAGEAFDATYWGWAATIASMYAQTALRWLPGGPSFDDLAARSGRRIVHDKIHLTEAAASCLLDLVTDVLSSPPR